MVAGTYKLRRIISLNDESKAANDGQMIAEARSEPTVFVQLYRRHYDAVFRYCAHRLFDRHTAEDITAEVFLRFVENLDRFRGNEQQFRNWLYKIATNAVNDHLRRTARRSSLLKGASRKIDSQVADCDESAEKIDSFERSCAFVKAAVPDYHHIAFFREFKINRNCRGAKFQSRHRPQPIGTGTCQAAEEISHRFHILSKSKVN
jgi:RNA polymerase sigma factor (sigma-70 family)